MVWWWRLGWLAGLLNTFIFPFLLMGNCALQTLFLLVLFCSRCLGCKFSLSVCTVSSTVELWMRPGLLYFYHVVLLSNWKVLQLLTEWGVLHKNICKTLCSRVELGFGLQAKPSWAKIIEKARLYVVQEQVINPLFKTRMFNTQENARQLCTCQGQTPLSEFKFIA